MPDSQQPQPYGLVSERARVGVARVGAAKANSRDRFDQDALDISQVRIFRIDAQLMPFGDQRSDHVLRKHIGFVFQFFNLLPMLTAEENIVLPLSIAGEDPDKQWLEDLLGQTGLKDRRTHRPAELSGGQQQRVALARALVTRPTILFADEPTGNLDSKTGGEILDLLRASVDAYGQTTVMVTHEARAAVIADRILFIADGLIVRELRGASAAEVLDVMAGLGS